MRRPSALVRSSLVLTSLMPLQGVLSEQRHQQSSDSAGETTSSRYQTSNQQRISPSNSNSRGYPLGTAGVPKKMPSDGRSPWASAQQDKDLRQPSRARQSPFTGAYDPFLDDVNGNQDILSARHQTSIVYRYYSRQNPRNQSAGSVPFLLLGPNVDHWKFTAQQLSARGFNVIAVARAETPRGPTDDEGPASELRMVKELLDALRWNKVVLVGCDGESVLAIQAALQLAPKRIVGLVLCGNLNESERLVAAAGYGSSAYALDQYLHHRLPCPFTIVWNGDTTTGASEIERNTDTVAAKSLLSAPIASPFALRHHRTVLIGGGSAPHRRRPEVFAWILTRFVEDKIAPPIETEHLTHSKTAWRDEHHEMHLPWYLDEIFNEESFVVFGRVAATALFYAMMLKVLFYQFDNVRDGMDLLASVKRNVVDAIKKTVCNFLSVSFFFRRKSGGKSNIRSRETSDDDGGTRAATSEEGTADHKDEAKGSLSGEQNQDDMPEDESAEDDDLSLENQPPKKDLRHMFFLDHVVA